MLTHLRLRVGGPAARAPATARLFRATPSALVSNVKDRGTFDNQPDAEGPQQYKSFGWKHRPQRERQGGVPAQRGPMQPGLRDYEERPTWDDPEAAHQEAILQFIDPYELNPDLGEPGRRWRAPDLRGKSNEDLQKLYVVLLRERNMLHSTRMLHRLRKTEMPHKDRLRKNKDSMAMVKVVLGERQREKTVRDRRIYEELVEERVRAQIDFDASEVRAPPAAAGPRPRRAPLCPIAPLPRAARRAPRAAPPRRL